MGQLDNRNPGGSGSGKYAGASPSTVAVGLLPVGYALTGKSFQQIFEDMLAGFVAPSFSSFAISGQSQTLEVGDTISGTKSFTWGFTIPGNVQANTMDITDVNNAVELATDISNTSPASIALPTPITKTAPGAHTWRGSATDSQGNAFNSGNFTVNWYWKIYAGANAAATLDEAAIEALAYNTLSNSIARTYATAAGNYKYFAWPDSLGSPTSSTGFKDQATGLAIAMADSSDNAAYSNTQNGWSYALVSVTNANGIATNYRVYRTKNQLGGALNAVVS